MTFDDEKFGPNNFDNLGQLLVYLRRSYGERTGFSAKGAPNVTVSALSIADCLKKHGYSMTSGSYSMLEQGKTLPKSPEAFFESICKCLAVEPTSKYWALLRYQYLFDHARRYVDEEFAVAHFPRGQHALDLMRDGLL